jgi:hypothetical protein
LSQRGQRHALFAEHQLEALQRWLPVVDHLPVLRRYSRSIMTTSTMTTSTMTTSTYTGDDGQAIEPGTLFERRGEVREIVVVAGDHVTWRKPGSAITHRMWMPYWRRWLEPVRCKSRLGKGSPTS